MLREKDLLKELKISKYTLYQWRNEGLPFIKVRHLVFYDIVNVHKWMEKQSVESVGI